MRELPAIDQTQAAVCQERVRSCDVVRGHLRHPLRLAGSEDRPEVSYTELEFDTASDLEIRGSGWCSCWMRRRRTPAFRPNG